MLRSPSVPTLKTCAQLDHVVIASSDLKQGTRTVENLLGVKGSPGGKHITQGTHNQLIRLGSDAYLEVIAADPDAQPPDDPRWFDLDSVNLRNQLAQGPHLITWAVCVDNIERAVQVQPYDQYSIHCFSRGDFRWRASLSRDGGMPGGGLLPLVIQWDTDLTPPERLPESGCFIEEIEIRHPDPPFILTTLDHLGIASEINALCGTPRLTLRVRTETSVVELHSQGPL